MIELPIRVAAPDVSHVDALASGTRLGEFEIRGLIGVGGFGMVYRAYDHSLQREVAIKEYMPTALASRADSGLSISVRASNDEETFQTGLRSFVGEARMLAKFEHPSLVRVFRFWEANDTAYMVMPLYKGMTLKQARQCMRLPPSEAWLRKVLWSILGALKVLHRGKALHRDVSPDNIFLQDTGPPVLLDLGAARLAISDSSKQHTAILKIHYAPIEQYADAHGLPQGPWTDLYALAAVVHGMLCNEAPLPAMIRVVNDTMPAIENIAKTVANEFGQSYSEQFTRGIAWALQIQPQDRPQSVREFARALEIVTPNGMSTFDWRAELGAASLPAGEVLQLAIARTAEDKTRPNNTDPGYATTQFIDSDAETDHPDDGGAATIIADWGPDATPPAQTGAPADRRHRPREPLVRPPPVAESDSTARRRKPSTRTTPKHAAATQQRPITLWVMVGMLALATLAATAWGLRDWDTKGKTAPSSVSMHVLPEETILTEATASGSSNSASAPVAAEPIETIVESSTPARPASATAPAAMAKASERARNTAVKPGKPEAPRPTVTETASAPVPVAVAAPPAPDPKPAPPPVTAESLCTGTNFLSRPMCLFRACQRGDLSGTATCVELQKNLQSNKESGESSKF
ncbi:MAG: serine/threonine-protein kinase [Pseudomonadota bacterium]